MRLKEMGLWEGRRVDLPEQWGAGHTREAAIVFQTFWKSWANYIADGSSIPCTVSGWKSFVCNICMKPLYSSLVLELVSRSPVILITMHMLGVLMHCLGESDKKTGLHMFSIGRFFSNVFWSGDSQIHKYRTDNVWTAVLFTWGINNWLLFKCNQKIDLVFISLYLKPLG